MTLIGFLADVAVNVVPRADDQDYNSAVVYNYASTTGNATIASRGNSGTDDDDAVTYT